MGMSRECLNENVRQAFGEFFDCFISEHYTNSGILEQVESESEYIYPETDEDHEAIQDEIEKKIILPLVHHLQEAVELFKFPKAEEKSNETENSK